MFKLFLILGSLLFVSCTGNDGKDALQQLTVLSDASAENCPTGGTTVIAGIDSNGNGQLDEGEVTSRQHICNGSEPLTLVTIEEPGENCEFGGSLIQTGLDDNQNGQLDVDEITSFEYVCNDPVLTTVTDEPMCFPGGKTISTGYDHDNNGVLEESEVSSTTYIDCVYLRSTILVGSDLNESNASISTDISGNIIVAGSTDGQMDATPIGMKDVFVRKIDAEGNSIWTKQFGSINNDFVFSSTTDSVGNIYITGTTSGNLEGIGIGVSDAFLRKYDPDGNVIWTKQFGTVAEDNAYSVVTDSLDNVIVAGTTMGSLETSMGYLDGFIRKFNSDGDVLWTRQFGTGNFDRIESVTVGPDDSITACGNTPGNFAGITNGDYDFIATQYSPDGTLIWAKQYGSSGADYITDIASLSDGRVILVGYTTGSLYNQNEGAFDAIAAILSPEGNFISGLQIGSLGDEKFTSVSVGENDEIYLSGTSSSSLYSSNPENYTQPVLLITDPGLFIYESLQLPYSGNTQDISVESSGEMLIVAGTVDASSVDGLSTVLSDVFVSILRKQ
ncbi:SBBP repeat-containing protein [Myxococcota bacterium]|nr:SBBP repeat-containing protein [Myxococcota bacterium]MBU1381176.1 SBBP repeat-containing protein [Myxococcota bacterium]MBU1498788.1 SBBP repeat-containing protein [Myxococcota bacterium]